MPFFYLQFLLFLVRYNFSCPNNGSLSNSRKQYEFSITGKNENHSKYSNLSEELKRLNSSSKIIELLKKHIDWHVRTYEVNNNEALPNCIEKNCTEISFLRVCETCRPTDNGHFISFIQTYYIVFVVLGLISILGNGMTFLYELKHVTKQINGQQEKARKVYHTLVLNLCVADCLMGIYLIVCSLAIAKIGRVNSNMCNALGVISTLSLQTSTSFLTVITAYRLYGVVYPFKTIRTKFTVVLLLFIWIIWLIVIAFPLFNKTIFAYEFTRGIRFYHEKKSLVFADISIITKTVQKLALAVNSTDQILSNVLYDISKFENNEVSVQLSKSLNLLSFERDEMNFVDYYFPNSGCTVEFFNWAKNDTISYYSLSFLILNLVGYIFIIIAYLVISKKISSLRLLNMLPCLGKISCLKTQNDNRPKKIIAENNQIFRRIFIIITTDLVCGIPICLIGLSYYFDTLINDCGRNKDFENTAYIAVAALFPLNSIINPYIYSFRMWKSNFRKCKQRLLNCI